MFVLFLLFLCSCSQDRLNCHFNNIDGVNSNKVKLVLNDYVLKDSNVPVKVSYTIKVIPIFASSIKNNDIVIENAENLLVNINIVYKERSFNSIIQYQRNDISDKWEYDDRLYFFIAQKIITIVKGLREYDS